MLPNSEVGAAGAGRCASARDPRKRSRFAVERRHFVLLLLLRVVRLRAAASTPLPRTLSPSPALTDSLSSPAAAPLPRHKSRYLRCRHLPVPAPPFCATVYKREAI